MKSILPVLIIYLSTTISFAQNHKKFQEKAEEAFNKNKIEEAIKYAEKAKGFAEIDAGKNSVDYANIVHDLGLYFYFNYEVEKGISLLEESSKLLKELLGENSFDYMLAYSDLGSVYYFMQYYKKAKSVFSVTLDIAVNEIGPNSLDAAYEYNKLGLAELALANFDQAKTNLEKCRQLFAKNDLDNSVDYASLLNNLANLYHDKKEYTSAEKYYKSAIKLYKKTSDYSNYDFISCEQNYGNFLSETFRYDEAMKVFENLEKEIITYFGKESLEYAKLLNEKGSIHNKTGNFSMAEKYYQDALNIKNVLLEENHPSIIISKNNLANLFINLGRYNEAEKILENITNQFPEKNSLIYADYLNNLAAAYAKSFKTEDAIKMMRKSIAIYEQKKEIPPTDKAFMYSNNGLIYHQFEFDEKAEQLFIKAKTIYESEEYTQNIEYANVLYNLALLYGNQQKIEEALKFVQKAYNLAKKMLHPANTELLNYEVNYAYFLEKNKNYDEAEKIYKKAMISYEKIINEQLLYMPQTERVKFINNIKLHFIFYKSFIIRRLKEKPELIEDLFSFHSLTKALVLNSSKDIVKKIYASNDNLLIENYNQLKNTREILNKVYSLPDNDIRRNNINIDSLETTVKTYERNLVDHEILKNQLKITTTSIKDVQNSLSDGEAFIDIVRIPHYGDSVEKIPVSYLLIVVSASGNPEFRILKNGRYLDEEGSDYYFKCIFNKTLDTYSYNTYLKDISPLIENNNKLYVSTDGIYNIININTLYNTERKKYLIDDKEITYVSNAKHLIEIKNSEPNANKNFTAHLFGYPNYYFDLIKNVYDTLNRSEKITYFGQSESREVRFDDRKSYYVTPLPGTKKEVESISSVLQQSNWNVNVYMNDEAQEFKIKELESPNILHIATHGFYDFDVEKDNESMRGSVSASIKNPLLRSGLMMAGSAYIYEMLGSFEFLQNVEDGILTANEAINLNLSKTDLVILSACESRIGKMTIDDADGVYGMQRSFIIAGAKAVIASSWAVDDKATFELMSKFYNNWVKLEDKNQAFRKAQLEIKEEFESPYYWGAFVKLGE
jgi:CHAT domain-containing protein/Tfp pilus assembly protein PilF